MYKQILSPLNPLFYAEIGSRSKGHKSAVFSKMVTFLLGKRLKKTKKNRQTLRNGDFLWVNLFNSDSYYRCLI